MALMLHSAKDHDYFRLRRHRAARVLVNWRAMKIVRYLRRLRLGCGRIRR